MFEKVDDNISEYPIQMDEISKLTVTDACVREAIHTRLWVQVMQRDRMHREDPAQLDWRPDPDVYQGEWYEGPGRTNPDPHAYPEEFPGSRRLEDWLCERGIVCAPNEPNDMSQYMTRVKGPERTLRASLEALNVDEEWVRETALCYALWAGAYFWMVIGEQTEHHLCRLPIGWGIHELPPHFSPFVDCLAVGGFCERVELNRFRWKPEIAPYGAKALPQLWGDGPNKWEQRKWELLYIWSKMPQSLKTKYLWSNEPLNLILLQRDLDSYFHVKTRRWSEAPDARPGFKSQIAEELRRLDYEDGLPGRKSRA